MKKPYLITYNENRRALTIHTGKPGGDNASVFELAFDLGTDTDDIVLSGGLFHLSTSGRVTTFKSWMTIEPQRIDRFLLGMSTAAGIPATIAFRTV